jgi:hypothetical protein
VIVNVQKPPEGNVADAAPLAAAPLKHWIAERVKGAPEEIVA